MNPFRALSARSVQPSPEMALVLLCARTRVDAEQRHRITGLAGGTIDWARVIDLAQRHGVLSLVYRSVHAVCRGVVPQSVLGRLQIDYHRNLARNLTLTHELLRVLALLSAEGVDAIPFKGPVLALAVYSDLALRQAGDLDLLVRASDFVKAKDVLLHDTFRPTVDLSPTQAWDRLPGNGQYDFIAPATGILVELHWDVTGAHFATNFDLMRIRKRLRHVDLAGSEVLT
ncbi:MAG: nucleotidyltransferase family protein, partial [Chloroflexi bacterium]|nr:nucleotidyltransferase family protein [Chloroflexota bacterium]